MNFCVSIKSHYGIPMHFLWKNEQFIKQQSVLSELKGNYTDNQACSLMIAVQPTNLVFKLSTINHHIRPNPMTKLTVQNQQVIICDKSQF